MGATPNRRMWIGLAAALAACLVPALAAAQSNVVVLGLRPIDGDREVAASLTSALKQAAMANPSWQVSDREVSLAQMSIAHGCEAPNATCLAEIAATLQTQGLVYGTLGRTSTGEEYDYTVELRLFNAETGAIERTITDRLPRGSAEGPALQSAMERYVGELAGAPSMGTLRVQTNVPGAAVTVDDRDAGMTDDDGSLVIEVGAGLHEIRVISSGYMVAGGSVTVPPRGEASLSVSLVEEGGSESGPSDGTYLSVPGLLSLVAGVGLLGGTVYSWVRLDTIQKDAGYNAYRRANPLSEDVCADARNGVMAGNEAFDVEQIASNCDESDTLEVLQYVFLGTGIALTGLGAYLLADGLSVDTEDGASLSLRPSFGRTSGRLDATLRF